MKYFIAFSFFFSQFLLACLGDEIIKYSIAPDRKEEVLCWDMNSVAIFKITVLKLPPSAGTKKEYYIGTATYEKEPELASQTNFPSEKIFVNLLNKISYIKEFNLFIGLGIENKPHSKGDWEKWLREIEPKYFILFMESLKIEFFKNKSGLDKKLKEIGYKKKIVLMDISKFFNDTKKIAKEID